MKSYRAALADAYALFLQAGEYTKSVVTSRVPRSVIELEGNDFYNAAVIIGPRVLRRVNRREWEHVQTMYVTLQKHMSAINETELLLQYDEALRVSEEIEARVRLIDKLDAGDATWIRREFEELGVSKPDMEQEPLLSQNCFEDVIEAVFTRLV